MTRPGFLDDRREFQALLDRGADPQARDEYGRTLLHLAAALNDPPAVAALLLYQRADPQARDKDGETPLHKAAALNDPPAVATLLLDRGADPQTRDQNGETPLHKAVWKEDPEMIALLLDRGADLHACDKHGVTPLHLVAGFSDTPAIVTLLLNRGADLHAHDKRGATPLHLAARFNDTPAIAALLLDRGADLHARDKRGATPLHLAARFNDTPAIAALLLARGADAKLFNKAGKLPVTYAKKNKALQGTEVYRQLHKARTTLQEDYVLYRRAIWSERVERIKDWFQERLFINLVMPAGFGLIERLINRFDPVDLDPGYTQLVKKGWSWPGVFFVLAWAFLIQVGEEVLHRERPPLEDLLNATGLQMPSPVDWFIFVGVILAIVPGSQLLLGLLILQAIRAFPAVFVLFLTALVVWRQLKRFHWVRAVLLSLVLVTTVVWFPSRASDGLVIGLACVFACMFGRWGNGWREQYLLRRGYKYKETVMARRSPVQVYVRRWWQ